METISLKMENELLNSIDSSLKKNRYSTRTEFIRDAIRSKLTQLEKEEAIKKLTEMKGSLKGKAKMSDEEARDLVAKEIAKKYGFKLD
jgi:metal-responsive CopG/Arc/MetJ family transcriptional regulator